MLLPTDLTTESRDPMPVNQITAAVHTLLCLQQHAKSTCLSHFIWIQKFATSMSQLFRRESITKHHVVPCTRNKIYTRAQKYWPKTYTSSCNKLLLSFASRRMIVSVRGDIAFAPVFCMYRSDEAWKLEYYVVMLIVQIYGWICISGEKPGRNEMHMRVWQKSLIIYWTWTHYANGHEYGQTPLSNNGLPHKFQA